MTCWLKQSTAVEIAIGPFLDSTDGNTVESALTITQPDIRLKKDGAAWAQKNAAQTLTHEENGWYEIALDATDTNTLGQLIVAIHESGALPVWREFMVVPANVYDSFFSTDFLQVDVTQWLGTNAATPTVAGVPEVDLTHWLGVAPFGLASQRVLAISSLGSDAIDNSAIAADTGLKSIRAGTAQAGAAGSITLDASASAVNDFYKGARIHLHSGTGVGQSRLCVAYDGTTKIATVEPNWITNPASGTGFSIRSSSSTLGIATGGIASSSFTAGAINAAAIASGAIDDDALAADTDNYAAKVWLVKQSSTMDQYGVTFYKNGQPLESGISSPVIDYIKKLSDGSILVNDASLTDQGNGDYYYGESTNRVVAGNIYMSRVTATIDGSTKFMKQPVGRDSA